MKRHRSTSPSLPVHGSRLSQPGRRSSMEADAGIDDAVDNVDQEICERENDCEGEDDALHHGIIARGDRINERLADARPREDGFYRDYAAQHAGELEASH